MPSWNRAFEVEWRSLHRTWSSLTNQEILARCGKWGLPGRFSRRDCPNQKASRIVQSSEFKVQGEECAGALDTRFWCGFRHSSFEFNLPLNRLYLRNQAEIKDRP